MSANGISHLSTKEARQKAKLALAAGKRQDTGNPRSTYDLSQLPTQYDGNSIVNNANPGGLVQGRPWFDGVNASPKYADGLYRTRYSGYFADVPTWFSSASVLSSTVDTSPIDFTESTANVSYQLLGYFLATTTDTYSFYLNSDDASYMWIGASAITGFTTGNALINNGGTHGSVELSATVSLVEGAYYPIRIQFGNGPASGVFTLSYSNSVVEKTTDVSTIIFYNTATNGI